MSTEYYVASQIAECGNALGKTTKEVRLHYLPSHNLVQQGLEKFMSGIED